MKNSKLIVMLTHNDYTVENALRIFDTCKYTKANYWGCKEAPLPADHMKELFSYMKAYGKTTFLEVVAYTEKECVEGAVSAVKYGADYLMGTCFFESVNSICCENGIRYMPFVGDISERPSILKGNAADMINEACEYYAKGAFGVDFLGYRYTGDTKMLNRTFLSAMANQGIPVCAAGGVNSYEKLDEILELNADMFTIGSGFFEKCFGETFESQVNNVCDYIYKKQVLGRNEIFDQRINAC